MQDHLGEGVVNLASACEIETTQYIDRKGMSGNPDVRDILRAKKQSFAERRYHHLNLRISGRSLKAEGHESIQTTEEYLGVEQDLTDAPCDGLGLRIS